MNHPQSPESLLTKDFYWLTEGRTGQRLIVLQDGSVPANIPEPLLRKTSERTNSVLSLQTSELMLTNKLHKII